MILTGIEKSAVATGTPSSALCQKMKCHHSPSPKGGDRTISASFLKTVPFNATQISGGIESPCLQRTGVIQTHGVKFATDM